MINNQNNAIKENKKITENSTKSNFLYYILIKKIDGIDDRIGILKSWISNTLQELNNNINNLKILVKAGILKNFFKKIYILLS